MRRISRINMRISRIAEFFPYTVGRVEWSGVGGAMLINTQTP
jgi:hypothetical protein